VNVKLLDFGMISYSMVRCICALKDCLRNGDMLGDSRFEVHELSKSNNIIQITVIFLQSNNPLPI